MTRRGRFSILVIAAVAVIGLLMGVGAPAASAAQGSSRLLSGEKLLPGQQLISAGAYRLTMRKNGNLVQTDGTGEEVWSTGTRRPGSILRMQRDGNLVVIAPGNKPVWSTRTGENPGSSFKVQADGKMVVASKTNEAIWSTDSPERRKPSNGDDGIYDLRRQLRDAMCDSISSTISGPTQLVGPEAAVVGDILGDVYNRSCKTGKNTLILEEVADSFGKYVLDKGFDSVSQPLWGRVMDKVFDRMDLDVLTTASKNAVNKVLFDEISKYRKKFLDCHYSNKKSVVTPECDPWYNLTRKLEARLVR